MSHQDTEDAAEVAELHRLMLLARYTDPVIGAQELIEDWSTLSANRRRERLPDLIGEILVSRHARTAQTRNGKPRSNTVTISPA